jgi:excisionase family DNA binding protein
MSGVMGALEDLQERVESLERERVERRESSGWLDVAGAAEYLSMGRDGVRHAIRAAGLPVHRTPTNRLLFSKDELDEWVRSS